MEKSKDPKQEPNQVDFKIYFMISTEIGKLSVDKFSTTKPEYNNCVCEKALPIKNNKFESKIFSLTYNKNKVKPFDEISILYDNSNTTGKYKINVNDKPASLDTLVHEVQIRMDMAKIKFNSIMIKFKLHKIFKRLLYQPKDFYFMSKDQEKERQNDHIIRNIKGINNIKKCSKFSDSNSLNSDNNSTTGASSIDNNYSRLDDDDTEPLKK